MDDLAKLTDEELVEVVRKSNPELYSEVVSRYQEKLWRYAMRLLGDQDAARDVVQEAFIKAYMNLNGFDTKLRLSPWLYRIVHNEVVSFCRREKKSVSLDDNFEIIEKMPSSSDTREEVERNEMARLMQSNLKKLPLPFREVVTLFYLEELSYQEISDVLHIPINTVGSRINRGKKMLRDAYNLKKGEL